MERYTRFHKKSRQPGRQVGQSLLEFTLLLPLLLLFVFGALDLGRAFFSVIVIQNATRAGAREGITLPNTNPTQRLDEIIQMTVQEAQNGWINITAGMVAVTCPHPQLITAGNCARGNPLRVTVTYPFQLSLNWMVPASMQFQRHTEMLVP